MSWGSVTDILQTAVVFILMASGYRLHRRVLALERRELGRIAAKNLPSRKGEEGGL